MLGRNLTPELSQQGALIPSAIELHRKGLGTIYDVKYPKIL